MTANQINYWALQETKRSNQAREDETERSNRAKESETQRSNLVKERETYRSNTANESIMRNRLITDASLGAVKSGTELLKLFI